MKQRLCEFARFMTGRDWYEDDYINASGRETFVFCWIMLWLLIIGIAYTLLSGDL